MLNRRKTQTAHCTGDESLLNSSSLVGEVLNVYLCFFFAWQTFFSAMTTTGGNIFAHFIENYTCVIYVKCTFITGSSTYGVSCCVLFQKQGNFSAVLLGPTINNAQFTVFLYSHTYCLSYNIIVEYNKWISVWETIRFLVQYVLDALTAQF